MTSGGESDPLASARAAAWLSGDSVLGVRPSGMRRSRLAEARRLMGPLDRGALQRAVEAVRERHDALRWRMPMQGEIDAGSPAAAPPVCLEVRGCGDGESLPELLRGFVERPFDADSDAPLRLLLLEVAPEEHVLLMQADELALDERSLHVLWEELAALYDTSQAGGTLILPDAPSVGSWTGTYRQALDEGRFERQRDFWHARLQPGPPVLELPRDVRGGTGDPDDRGMAGVALSPSLVERVNSLITRTGATPFLALLTAVQALLQWYTAEGDIAVATSMRIPGDAVHRDQAVGQLSNTIVLRTTVQPGETFATLLERNARTVLEARLHREYPFARLEEEAFVSRRSDRGPLFHALLSCEEREVAFAGAVGTLTCEALDVDWPDARPGLVIGARWSAGTARLQVSLGGVNRSSRVADQLAAHLARMLDLGARSPDAPLGSLPLLDLVAEGERQRHMFGPIREAGPSAPELIEAWVARTPTAIAVSQGEWCVTYEALWHAAGAVACALRANGVATGDIVGIASDRTPELLSLLLGVWRAGASYLPLDPQFPARRLAFMVADSGCRLVLADRELDWLPSAVRRVDGATLVEPAVSAPLDVPRDQWSPVEMAYLLYTSGSTGTPKGVDVPHGALANLLASMAEAPGFSRDETLLAVTTLSFDIAGLELWLPLTRGGRVELAATGELSDPSALMARLATSPVTVMQATPTTWRMLVAAGWPGRLRRLLCGGEAFPPELVAPLCERADEVWNVYGPTETTVWSTIARVVPPPHGASGGIVSIGRPIDNTRVYVVDSWGRLVAPGVAGEIWIAGEGVATGYRGRPELTAERFVPDPFVPGGRAYRTGDLGRWTLDGELEHLGRLDGQVKVNGHRIELGEIESALATAPEVRHAVASVCGPADDPRLVAYVRFDEAAPSVPSASELRRLLRQSLPDYMVPAMILPVDSIPLTPNGKVDRRALPDPFAGSTTSAAHADDAPVGAIEQQIAAVWRDVLGVERVGRLDNFFEIGGHSLLALRAVWRLQHEHGILLDPRAMFFSSLAQLAAGQA